MILRELAALDRVSLRCDSCFEGQEPPNREALIQYAISDLRIVQVVITLSHAAAVPQGPFELALDAK
jgi:hypothetical protein